MDQEETKEKKISTYMNPLGLETSIPVRNYQNDLVFLSLGHIWKWKEIMLTHKRLKLIKESWKLLIEYNVSS